jgi:hypothetical protein
MTPGTQRGILERAPATKTDLVLAMTLAELFLLLLFIAWYATAPPGAADLRSVVQQQQEKISKLERMLKERHEKIADLEPGLEWWRQYFNLEAPKNKDELIGILMGTPQGREIVREAGRGLPRCEEKNVWAHVTARDGT